MRSYASALAGLACGAIAAPAAAGLVGASVENLGDLGGGTTTWRIYLDFDHPADQLLAVSANASVSPLVFVGSEAMVNEAGPFNGLDFEDKPSLFAAAWDSWVTIGNDSATGNDTAFSPGFLGGGGGLSVINGNSFSQADQGGWFDQNPGTPNASGGHVLIMQVTVGSFVLRGTAEYTTGGAGTIAEAFVIAAGPGQSDCNRNGVLDFLDIAAGTSADVNRNGIPDECDEDCNGNGTPDFLDLDSGTSSDFNGNGIPDECDPDCDGNGTPDFIQLAQGSAFDCDLNGVLDVCDVAEGTLPDENGNGIPDGCEVDCNGNGAFDFIDLFLGSSVDCDGDGVPDECGNDCNGNGVADECDLREGTSSDLDGDGVPDDCQPDCNGNLVPDGLDIDLGTSPDCNANGVPDECDAGTTSPDVNADGVPDECQCLADGNRSGTINFADLIDLLAHWGSCPQPCPWDVNGDGEVGFTDLVYLLAHWGAC